MKKPTPELALLLRRMYITGCYDKFNDVAIAVEKADWEPQLPEHEKRHLPGAKALRELGLEHDEMWNGHQRFWLPAGFEVPTIADVLAHMNPDGKASVNELTAYILLKGKVYGTYGSYPWQDELIHTLLCGIDWSKSSEPQNDTWSEFAGTFAENERESMTEVQLYCLCGHVDQWHNACHVGVEELSIADLLKITEGEMRDRI
jgi:predicted heme/steroid binding protein